MMPLILKGGFLMLTYTLCWNSILKLIFKQKIWTFLSQFFWTLLIFDPHCRVGVCLLYFCSCILLSRNRFFLHDASLMVFLAPKRQAKVHETTRKLKSIEHTRQQTMLQFSFTWTWLNLSSSSSFTKYNDTKEIRIVVYSSSFLRGDNCQKELLDKCFFLLIWLSSQLGFLYYTTKKAL